MNKSYFHQILIAVLSVVVMSSCGSLEVTKRRHMPGYHVELNTKKQQPLPVRDHAAAPSVEMELADTPSEMKVRTASVDVPAGIVEAPDVTVTASVSNMSEPGISTPVERIVPSMDGEKVQLAMELRKAVSVTEGDEKYGWSIIAFIAFGLGVIAFVMMFVALVWMIAFGPLWFVPAIVGIMFGIGAIITGAIGLKQTKRGGKKGRGFALAGMIAGILGVAISLISLLVGAIRTIVN